MKKKDNNINCNIFWIYLNRFDENISKIPRLEIAETLINLGFSVTLLSGFRKKQLIPENYKIKIEYFKALNTGPFFKISLILKIFFWLLKKAKESDILIIPPGALPIGVLLKNLRRCKLHLDIRTYPVEMYKYRAKIESIIYWYIPLRLFVRKPDTFSFITELLKERIEQDYNIKFKNYVIWHSGVNVEHFSVVRNTIEKKIKFILTYVGVVTKNRGIDRVLFAIEKLEEKYKEKVIFNVIGDGNFLWNLTSLAKRLYIENIVKFHGFIPYKDIPQVLKDTDCFICPLPNRLEWNISSPIKIFEYLACARPIILTPIIAHKNIAKNLPFIIWTDNDRSDAIVRAIEYAISNKEKLLMMPKTPKDILKKHYSWKEQGKKFAKYLLKNSVAQV